MKQAGTPRDPEPGRSNPVRLRPGQDQDAATGREPRTFTIELPAGMALLSLNQTLHWARQRSIARDIRKAAWACAISGNIPPLERARIVVEYRPRLLSRRRDADNVPAASGKHAIDGIVDARVLPDDDYPGHVAGLEYRIGEPCPKGRLVLHVTEEPARPELLRGAGCE